MHYLCLHLHQFSSKSLHPDRNPKQGLNEKAPVAFFFLTAKTVIPTAVGGTEDAEKSMISNRLVAQIAKVASFASSLRSLSSLKSLRSPHHFVRLITSFAQFAKVASFALSLRSLSSLKSLHSLSINDNAPALCA